MKIAELEAVVRRSMTAVLAASGLPPNGNTTAMNEAVGAILAAAREYAARERQKSRGPSAPAAVVCYLTPNLRIPCRPDLSDMEGAPLNTVFRDKVTCSACKASPEYQAGMGTGGRL